MDKGAFRQAIEEALDHLHDVVALRVMPLCDLLALGAPRQRRGWALAQRLLESVEALRPDQEEGDTWPRRRYEVLALRYVSGLTPDQVALRLSVSRRHFYRQLQRALDDYADYLWLEVSPATAVDSPPEEPLPTSPDSDETRLSLLQQEASRQAATRARASLQQSVERVAELLTPLLAQQKIGLTFDLAHDLPLVAISPDILRQLLLALLSEVLQDANLCCVCLRGAHVKDQIMLTVEATTSPGQSQVETKAQAWQERASVELARMQGVRIVAQEHHERLARYVLGLPLVAERTVLVVDDNEDVCALLRRYLLAAGYAPLIATSGAQAIVLARHHTLHAITLDLMMYQEDGWDVLQTLSHDPETADVPVIVCSVLDQQDLARMMGAKDFIKKPVMAHALIEALERLAPPDQSAI